MNILGFVEQVSPTGVAGWAADASALDARVTVEVFAGGALVGSGLADQYRSDLVAAGYGDGKHGFFVPLPNDVGEISCRVGPSPLPYPGGDDPVAQKSGDFWDTISEVLATMPPRARWPESPHIVRDHNQRVCGRIIEGGTNRGVIELFKERAGHDIPAGRAVSIGCGPGYKEMILLQDGIVSHFDLYDVAQESLNAGRRYAEEHGLTDRVTFIHGYDFARDLPRDYDLVYWDSALHHMPDATAAVKWSHDALKPGGWFLMADFVGANRFQWSDTVYEIADLIRGSLPDECYNNPINPAVPFSRKLHRATLADMDYDPSEAADSEAIIPAIEAYFPDAEIRHVGGTIYHMVLNDVLTNIPEESPLLEFMLRLDRNVDIPHFAVALARKPLPDAVPEKSWRAGLEKLIRGK